MNLTYSIFWSGYAGRQNAKHTTMLKQQAAYVKRSVNKTTLEEGEVASEGADQGRLHGGSFWVRL